MNRNVKKTVASPGSNEARRNKQTGYLFYLLFGTIMLVLVLALFNALWSESALFQWLLIGSMVSLVVGAVALRFVFHMHIKTKHVVLFLMLISLAGTAFIGMSSRRGLKHAGAAFVIDGYAVTARDLDRRTRAIEQEIRQIRAQVGPYADMFLQMRGYVGQPRDIATRQMTQEKLLLSAADRLGITSVSPDYIASRLRDSNFVINNLSQIIPPYLAQGNSGVDGAKLSQYLTHQGITTADFEESLEAALRSHSALMILPTGLYAPQVSVQRAADAARATRQFAIENFSLDNYIAKQRAVPISQEALKSFFDEQNKSSKRYYTPEKRRGIVWEFTADNYNLPVSDVEIRRYFADHGKEFGTKQLSQVKSEIEKALIKEKFKKRFTADAQRIIALNDREPEAFNEFVGKRRGKKEELGWVTRTDSKKPEVKALFSLLKVGQKQAIATENQGFVVMLTELQPSTLPALIDIHDRVAADLRTDWAEKALKKDLEARLEQVKTQGVSALRNPQTITAKTKEDWEKLGKQGLPVEQLKRMIHPGAAITAMQAGDKAGTGSCIVLATITPPVAGETGKPDFASEFTSRENSFFASAFIASLNSSVTIKKSGKQRANDYINDEE